MPRIVQKSNDLIKLKNLLALIEVKGSHSLSRASDNKIADIYEKDLLKLSKWKEVVSRAMNQYKLDCDEPEYVFIGVDTRSQSLNGKERNKLDKLSDKLGVKFLYIPRNA